MDQMIVWAFVHREFARIYGKRQRSDDAFYDSGPGSMAGIERGRRLLGVLWPAAARRR